MLIPFACECESLFISRFCPQFDFGLLQDFLLQKYLLKDVLGLFASFFELGLLEGRKLRTLSA